MTIKELNKYETPITLEELKENFFLEMDSNDTA